MHIPHNQAYAKRNDVLSGELEEAEQDILLLRSSTRKSKPQTLNLEHCNPEPLPLLLISSLHPMPDPKTRS
jgi:hypothetical protein